MADGTDKRQTFQKATLYRDLEGRTRTETTITLKRGTADPSLSSFVEIIDPVAGYRYMLDPQKETASRSLWPPTRQQADGVGSTATSSSVSGNEQTADKAPVSRVSTNYSFTTAPETTHQSLGTQMIEGITTEGALTTTTYPSGFMGSEMPVTATWEHWISPELKIVVLAKTSDSRYGETTVRLTGILRNEPDQSLFQVPAGYSTSDQ
jgi:hypothetical protein